MQNAFVIMWTVQGAFRQCQIQFIGKKWKSWFALKWKLKREHISISHE